MTSNKQSLSFLIILSGLMACTSLTTDIYLPAMPTMERELHGDAEWTITGFLIGFAIAQLLWGPISDRIGRKKPLYMGMFLFVIGSVGCACSHTILEVTAWRILQALGACVGPMLSRTMIRDLYAFNPYYYYGYSSYCWSSNRWSFVKNRLMERYILANGDNRYYIIIVCFETS